MEVERHLSGQQIMFERENKRHKFLKRLKLLFYCVLLAIGACGGPLILRLYYVHGGARVWLTCWLESVGFVIMIVPLLVSYFRRRMQNTGEAKTKPFLITWRLFAANAGLGIFTGGLNYIGSYAAARLPVSTSSLLLSTQLAFTAVLAFLMVKQKFTSYSVNAVALLCVAAVLLGLHSGSDRPPNITDKEYNIGFFLMILDAAMFGFLLPAMELIYKKTKQKLSYTLLVEMQCVMSLFATGFCTVGMLVNKDFQAISREAKAFAIGEVKYYVVLVASAIIWQLFFLGSVGIIFGASSLFCGVLISFLLPITEVLGVIFYNESFSSEKGIALALSLWGFASYFTGEYKKTVKEQTLQIAASTSEAALDQECDGHISLRVVPE